MSGHGITVVIVSRDMLPMLRLCLHHLRAALNGREVGDQFVIVDNASDIPYAAGEFDNDVHLIRFDTHHSFAACCNAGMRRNPNPFYLMLNNDVMLHPDAVSGMLSRLVESPRVGVSGTRLVYPDGTIQHCGMRFGDDSMGPYHVHRRTPSARVSRESMECQAVSAACMLLKHELIDELNGFDETFPFAWEDVDLCLRARQCGWRVFCDQRCDSLHFESMTPGREEMDPPSREAFMERWLGKWTADG